MIPLTFVLAFYMNHVVQRWWETWKMIPWPFSIAIKVNTFLPGKVKNSLLLKVDQKFFPFNPMSLFDKPQDDDRRQIRRNVVRYICLSITETYRMLSVPVKKRFPTYQHLVDAGLLTNNEVKPILLKVESCFYFYDTNRKPSYLFSDGGCELRQDAL